MTAEDLSVVAVLSGNRNFESRIHPLVKASYLGSPPLVVAYALAGTVNIDLTKDPIGHTKDGKPVMLSELWPSQEESLGSSAMRAAGHVQARVLAHLRRRRALEDDVRADRAPSSSGTRNRRTSTSRRTSRISGRSPNR